MHLDPYCDFQRDYYATFKRLSRVKSKKAHKKKEISIQAQNALKFARSFAQRIHCAYRATLSFFITKVCELDAKHPPIATYLFMIILFDPRDRTECICKSQTWLPACRDEHPDANAELSRGAGPLAELMRDVHSHKVSSVKYSNKKGKRKSKIYKLYSEISSIPAQRLQPSSLIRADVSIHDQALHSLLGHKCIDLCTTDVKASERRAAGAIFISTRTSRISIRGGGKHVQYRIYHHMIINFSAILEGIGQLWTK